MPLVRVHCDGVVFEVPVEAGASLMSAILSLGPNIQLNFPCGGRGVCGKCLVVAVGELSPPTPEEAHLEGNLRLACRTCVLGDVDLFVSVGAVGAEDAGMVGTYDIQDFADGADEADKRGVFKSSARFLSVGISMDRMCGHSSLQGFLMEASRGFGGGPLRVSDLALAGLSELLARRSAEGILWSMGDEVLWVGPVGEVPIGIAADVGSSSIEMAVLDLASGVVLGMSRRENPQRRLGVDVISRVLLAMEGGMEDLCSAVRGALNQQALDLLRELSVDPRRVVRLVVGCNTVVASLLFGIVPSSLAERPFLPWTLEARTVGGHELGLSLRCPVTLLPSIGGFVGSDSVALLCRHWSGSPDTKVILDLGTNGEVMLVRGEEVLAASTAAGPAFEGYGISCGMPATDGAICGADWEDGRVKLEVIGRTSPKGICGSGLLSVVSMMLREGMLDRSGRMAETLGLELQISQNPPIMVTQRDIREFQSAKGAIRAALEVLLEEAGVCYSHVNSCVVAGLFGGSLRSCDLVRVGLLPPQWEDRIIFSPQGVLEGLWEILFSGDAGLSKALCMASRCRHVPLDRPKFNDIFLRCLSLGEPS